MLQSLTGGGRKGGGGGGGEGGGEGGGGRGGQVNINPSHTWEWPITHCTELCCRTVALM